MAAGLGAKQDGTGWYSNVLDSTLVNYYQTWGHAGVIYYILHELVHNLPEAKAYERVKGDAFFAAHNSFEGWGVSAEQEDNEEFANSVYQDIAAQLNYVPIANPPEGYYDGP